MEPPSLPPTPFLQVDRAVAPIAFPDPSLEQVLRRQLFPPGSNPQSCQRQGGVRYVYNRVDLNGDRTPETLVALLGRQTCGKEGCLVLLLRDFGHSLTPLQTIGGFRNALVVSEWQSQGWRDLILPPPAGAEGEAAKRLSHNGHGYPTRPLGGRAGELRQASKGMAALVLKESPYLVQGHPLTCPSQGAHQRKSVLSKVPIARPRSSLLVAPLRPAVWVATKVMSAQRKIPVTPWFT